MAKRLLHCCKCGHEFNHGEELRLGMGGDVECTTCYAPKLVTPKFPTFEAFEDLMRRVMALESYRERKDYAISGLIKRIVALENFEPDPDTLGALVTSGHIDDQYHIDERGVAWRRSIEGAEGNQREGGHTYPTPAEESEGQAKNILIAELKAKLAHKETDLAQCRQVLARYKEDAEKWRLLEKLPPCGALRKTSGPKIEWEVIPNVDFGYNRPTYPTAEEALRSALDK